MSGRRVLIALPLWVAAESDSHRCTHDSQLVGWPEGHNREGFWLAAATVPFYPRTKLPDGES